MGEITLGAGVRFRMVQSIQGSISILPWSIVSLHRCILNGDFTAFSFKRLRILPLKWCIRQVLDTVDLFYPRVHRGITLYS